MVAFNSINIRPAHCACLVVPLFLSAVVNGMDMYLLSYESGALTVWICTCNSMTDVVSL